MGMRPLTIPGIRVGSLHAAEKETGRDHDRSE